MADPVATAADLHEATLPNVDRLTVEHIQGRPIVKIKGIRPFIDSKKKRLKIFLEGRDLPFVPCLTMLRLLKAKQVWGPDPAVWLGRTMELYVDPDVRNPEGIVTGGIRISRVSDITFSGTVELKAGKGKYGQVPIAPLGAPSFFDQLMELVTVGLVNEQQVHPALSQRRAQDVPPAEHAAILARLRGVQQTLPDTEPPGDEE